MVQNYIHNLKARLIRAQVERKKQEFDTFQVGSVDNPDQKILMMVSEGRFQYL